jgi:hypothetical protein
MYELHLERQEFDQKPISIDEWRQVIANDPEMTLSHTIDYTSPTGEAILKGGGNYAIWRPAKFPAIEIWFKYDKGTISAIYDTATLEKMRELAQLLDAIVYGDVGEEY